MIAKLTVNAIGRTSSLPRDQREKWNVHDQDENLSDTALFMMLPALVIVSHPYDRAISVDRRNLVQGTSFFHHDHGTVHDQAEIQRTHAHQVRTLPGHHHA